MHEIKREFYAFKSQVNVDITSYPHRDTFNTSLKILNKLIQNKLLINGKPLKVTKPDRFRLNFCFLNSINFSYDDDNSNWDIMVLNNYAAIYHSMDGQSKREVKHLHC